MERLKSKVIYRMAIVAIFSALVGLSGLVLNIPIMAGTGYINISDIFIILIACLIDPISGMLVGIIGGAFIDLFAGYPMYIPFTILIKGLEGFLAGYCFNKIKKRWLCYTAIILIALTCASLYFFADAIIISYTAAFISLPSNLFQGLVNAVLAIIVAVTLKKRYFDLSKS